jgi:hypothetical protein
MFSKRVKRGENESSFSGAKMRITSDILNNKLGNDDY